MCACMLYAVIYLDCYYNGFVCLCPFVATAIQLLYNRKLMKGFSGPTMVRKLFVHAFVSACVFTVINNIL